MMGPVGFRFKRVCPICDIPLCDILRRSREPPMSEVKTLYDEDFVLWSKQQAEALRAAARGGSNQPLDWENLAGEIEDLGKSDRRELGSRIREIIEHLVKLEHSRSTEPRRGWRASIRRQRTEIDALLKDSPSLRREVLAIIQDETRRGGKNAVADLGEYGELPASGRKRLKAPSYLDLLSYTAEQVLGDWFPPEPKEPPRGASRRG
jgi:hypothetical protein